MVGGLGDRGGVFREPLIKGPAVMDHHGGAHTPVIRTAELGADNRVGARPIGGEGENRRLAGDDVLLNAELGNPEGMDDIIGFHA